MGIFNTLFEAFDDDGLGNEVREMDGTNVENNDLSAACYAVHETCPEQLPQYVPGKSANLSTLENQIVFNSLDWRSRLGVLTRFFME